MVHGVKNKTMKSEKKGTMKNPVVIITRHGYEYHLVECADRRKSPHPQGKFMGYENSVLRCCKKIKMKKNKK
jgi:hypothetical protein